MIHFMAYRLSQKKKSLLIAIHVISLAAWIGGTLGMLLLGIYLYSAENAAQLTYTLASMEIIDENLLKYPALMTLLTGILLSLWTQWGLVKHYWVIIKLGLTIITIMIGIFFLNKWTDLDEGMGFASLQDGGFHSKWLDIVTTSSINLFFLLFMVFITYYKPFEKIKKGRVANTSNKLGS